MGALLPGRERNRVSIITTFIPAIYHPHLLMMRKKRYIVDAADPSLLPASSDELHELMSKPTLEGIPLLVLGNKSDLPGKLSVDELIEAMDLKAIENREVSCYGISAKEETNLDAVLHRLIARAKK